MIDDIVFDFSDFILEIPDGAVGTFGSAYSLDGVNYDFTSVTYSGGNETSHIFIS
jgi:hypothetical protein